MKVPYDQAQIKVFCRRHNVEVEFEANDDALGPLDRLQLTCPKLGEQVRDIHERQSRIMVAEAIRLALKDKEEHPEQYAAFPADFLPTQKFGHQDYSEDVTRQLMHLDRVEEDEDTLCFQSWQVELTVMPKDAPPRDQHDVPVASWPTWNP